MKNIYDLLMPHFAAAREGDWVELGDHRARPLVASQHCGGSMMLAEVEVDFLGGVPPHIHSREDETFYILEGRFAIGIADQTQFAGAGDTVFAPREIVHTWRCISESGGRMLLLVTPGENFEQFMRKMGEQKIIPGDAASLSAICALGDTHGLTMLIHPA